jgi:hypothetical protein
MSTEGHFMSPIKYLYFGLLATAINITTVYADGELGMKITPGLLTDPFLQSPEKNSIRIVWFTDFKGKRHFTTYGTDLNHKAMAKSIQLSRIRNKKPNGFIKRQIWRHECLVEGLTPGVRTPYHVTSVVDNDKSIISDVFSMQPLPEPGHKLRILLTSDHQQKHMTPANLQKVVETVGMVDAVFFAGDLTNIPDNAQEWFDDPQGLGFFAAFQGRTQVFNPNHPFRGGRILQFAPIFPCVGNHEVMGRFDGQFADFDKARPRWYAEMLHSERKQKSENNDPPPNRHQWIQDESFNTITYEEIFTLPDNSPGGELYYDINFGDIYLASLFITRHWRTPNINNPAGGKFHEMYPRNPESWLFGDFIFEDFGLGSKQYIWLKKKLHSPECRDAKYRLIMSHQTSRGVGYNSIPLLSHPVVAIEHVDPVKNTIVECYDYPPAPEVWRDKIKPLLQRAQKVRYDYPRQRDQWRLYIEPLLSEADIHLVLHGHSHLWYRMRTKDDVVYLETSNVGNSYGAYLRNYKSRTNVPPYNPSYWDPANYAAYDDPYGADLRLPTIYSPMVYRGRPLPTVDSNTLTVFSILETPSGIISSYVYDTAHPNKQALKFDEFLIRKKHN